MSSHLRHCPKHRKPLPCSHCALIANTPTITAKPAPAPVGRPRKHADNAAKQAAHRVKKSIVETVVQTEESVASKGKLHGESSYDDDGLAKIQAKLTRLELYG